MTKTKRRQLEVDVIREIYPVTKAIAYKNGSYEFIRTAKVKSRAIRPERGNIMSMSKQSLIRLMFTMQCTVVDFGSMFTLTYPMYYPNNGQVVKSDINLLAQKVRRLGWSYLWFLEFQKRGAPHIHFLLEPAAVTPRMRAEFGLFWTSRIAQAQWFWEKCPPESYITEVIKMAKFNCHHSTFQVLREKDGARNYATKYAAKEKQKKVPENYKSVGRFWGASRDVKPEGLPFDVTEQEVEAWLVEHNHPATAYELVPRYIWGVGTLNREGAQPVL